MIEGLRIEKNSMSRGERMMSIEIQTALQARRNNIE